MGGRQELLLQNQVARFLTSGPCVDDNVKMTWDIVGGFSEDFTKQALDSISNNGTAYFSGNSEPEAVMIQVVSLSKKDKSPRMNRTT